MLRKFLAQGLAHRRYSLISLGYFYCIIIIITMMMIRNTKIIIIIC